MLFRSRVVAPDPDAVAAPRGASGWTLPIALLDGFVRGLSGFGAFFLVLLLSLEHWPAGIAYACAWITAIAASTCW